MGRDPMATTIQYDVFGRVYVRLFLRMVRDLAVVSALGYVRYAINKVALERGFRLLHI